MRAPAALAVLILTTAGMAAAGGEPGVIEPVRARALDEVTPAAAEGLLAWAQTRGPGSESYDVYLKVGGRHAAKVNARGTEGFPGGFDGRRLVYQQVRDDLHSDLFELEIDTGKRSRFGRAVNTEKWEWSPSRSGPWILFGRGRDEGFSALNDKAVILYNLSSHATRRLDYVEGLGAYVFPGVVAGDTAVWARCTGINTCDSFRHDISAGRTSRLPNGGSAWQFAPSIAADGAIYAVRSGAGCGRNARLVRVLPAPTKEIADLTGYDVDRTVVSVEHGLNTVYFARRPCSGEAADIVRVVDRP